MDSLQLTLNRSRLSNRSGLSRQQRLKTPADYQRVYTSKQWGGSKHYTFNVNAADGLTCPKNNIQAASYKVVLGVTVSKKVSNKAVDRNRIKRQIKEFYRLHQHQLDDALCKIELVITAKPSCLGASDQQRHQSLEDLWLKVLKWHRWYQKQSLTTPQDKAEQP